MFSGKGFCVLRLRLRMRGRDLFSGKGLGFYFKVKDKGKGFVCMLCWVHLESATKHFLKRL